MTRDVELKLIDLGIQKLLETFKLQEVVKKETKKTNTRHKWTAAQHRKFSATMKKKWQDQRKAAQQ